jgi:hypothetical protein
MRGALRVAEEKPQLKVGENIARARTGKGRGTVASGTPILYDSGLKYDVYYYDRWIGDAIQPETPTIKVVKRNVKINTGENKPQIKVNYE